MKQKNIFSNALKDGVLLLLPFTITLGLIYWVWSFLRKLVPDISAQLPVEWSQNPYLYNSFDFLFLLFVVVVILFAGMIASTFLGKFLSFLIERLLVAPTFIRPIYTTFKKIAESVFQKDHEDSLAYGFSESILVPYPNHTTYSIGFITCNHAKHLMGEEEGDKWLTVYIPSSPIVSAGFYIICKKEDTAVCKLSSGKAMTTVISVGAIQNKLLEEIEIINEEKTQKLKKPNILGVWFTNGLLFLTPLIATMAILMWAFNYLYQFLLSITGLLPGILPSIIPAQYYEVIISTGLVVILIFIVMILGFLGESAVGFWIKSFTHRIFNKIPMFKEIYGIVEQIIHVFSPDPSKNSTFDQAVLIPYPTQNIYAIGFVTGQNCNLIKEDGNDFIPVFVPTTPIPTTGWFILAPRNQLIPLQMPIEKAFGLVISGGILTNEKE